MPDEFEQSPGAYERIQNLLLTWRQNGRIAHRPPEWLVEELSNWMRDTTF